MRRILTLAQEYANQRVAFGKYLRQHPLHAQTLSRMEVCRTNSSKTQPIILATFFVDISILAENLCIFQVILRSVII